MLVLSTPSFNKDISRIKDSKLAARITQVIQRMQLAGNISDLGGVKKLSGASNAYRVRIAEYRLGFTLSSNIIHLVIFAHRKEIYRYFP